MHRQKDKSLTPNIMRTTASRSRPFQEHTFVEWVDTPPSYDLSFPENNVIASGPDYSLFPQVFEWLGGRKVFSEAEADVLWMEYYLSEPSFLVDLLAFCGANKYLILHANGDRFSYLLTGDQQHLRPELTRLLKGIARCAVQGFTLMNSNSSPIANA